MFLDAPRGLADPLRLAQRRETLLTVPAVQPLRTWILEQQERRPETVCPDFDPAEAGIHARVMFLAEAPGPMSHTQDGSRRPGTGFISVDNPDQTAANCWTARHRARLAETGAIHWNIVPWYLGPASKKPDAEELAAGARALGSLLPLFHRLQVVVLAGLYAQKGWDEHMSGTSDLTVVKVPHPSPLAMAQAGKRDELNRGLQRVGGLLGPAPLLR